MNTRVGYQVGLKLREIDIEGTIESERGSDRADDLSDESIQIGVGRSFDIQVTTADIIDSL